MDPYALSRGSVIDRPLRRRAQLAPEPTSAIKQVSRRDFGFIGCSLVISGGEPEFSLFAHCVGQRKFMVSNDTSCVESWSLFQSGFNCRQGFTLLPRTVPKSRSDLVIVAVAFKPRVNSPRNCSSRSDD